MYIEDNHKNMVTMVTAYRQSHKDLSRLFHLNSTVLVTKQKKWLLVGHCSCYFSLSEAGKGLTFVPFLIVMAIIDIDTMFSGEDYSGLSDIT